MTAVKGVEGDWLDETLAGVGQSGYAVVKGVLDVTQLADVREAMYAARRKLEAQIGEERRTNELGTLRIPMKLDDRFFGLLELPEVLAFVDATLGDTAILQRQTGIVLPSFPPGEAPSVPQNRLHMDFRHVLGGALVSVCTLLALDDFSHDTGGTLVVPRSHQADPPPSEEELRERAIAVECPAGSMLAFDATLWHGAGENVSGRDRLAVNQRFAPPYMKQQFDYVRALGEDKVLDQSPRVQQLLGWNTRVPTSLDDYYRPVEERLYRPSNV
jgi:ectoine hydroxylase-related dioxygenase (phytanoyl-CoA dioxygenase family)